MNLAYRDVMHHLGRFLLTCVGLGLLLGVVLAMIGIYRGIVVEALTVVQRQAADVWVVEQGTRGPFAESTGFLATRGRPWRGSPASRRRAV